jgi:hypothetical protein
LPGLGLNTETGEAGYDDGVRNGDAVALREFSNRDRGGIQADDGCQSNSGNPESG